MVRRESQLGSMDAIPKHLGCGDVMRCTGVEESPSAPPFQLAGRAAQRETSQDPEYRRHDPNAVYVTSQD